MILYIASSFKHKHGVRLLARELKRLGCTILDWTTWATPPEGLTPIQRRIWMDTDQDGGQVYAFCRQACVSADMLIYYGASGQDAGVEIGMASACGIPILGIEGPLEAPGLMLNGAVDVWVKSAEDAIAVVEAMLINGHEVGPVIEAHSLVLLAKIAKKRSKEDKGCSCKK